MEQKKPWQSKTLIVNLIMALGAVFVPAVKEFIVANPETVTFIFAGINAVLRLVTKGRIAIVD